MTPTPKEIVGADPCLVIGTYLPNEDQIPKRFLEHESPWCDLADRWFYFGLKDAVLTPREGIDQAQALRHIRACLRSWQPSAQHKTVGVGYLMHCFFERCEMGGDVYEDTKE